MRIILIFVWIVFGAIVLWFFSSNLDQQVTLNVFTQQYENVNLVTVIFICFFLGTVLGALLLTTQILKSKAQLAMSRRENMKLLAELENSTNLPVEQESDPDQDINSGQ